MRLEEAVKAMESGGTLVAINLGEHRYCELDTNCPKAIELRKLMEEAGVDREGLQAAHREYLASLSSESLSRIQLPPLPSTMVTFPLLGQSVTIDVATVLQPTIQDAVKRRLSALQNSTAVLTEFRETMLNAYINEVRRLRLQEALAQLTFPPGDMARYKPLINRGRDCYLVYMPVTYNPQYLVSNGVRFQIDDADVARIMRAGYLEFSVAKDGVFLHVKLMNHNLMKLQHYHGDTRSDCWGTVVLPRTWDWTLPRLATETTRLMGALSAINLDSLMVSQPDGMPHHTELRGRSIRLGVEGRTETPTTPAPQRPAVRTPQRERVGWGVH